MAAAARSLAPLSSASASLGLGLGLARASARRVASRSPFGRGLALRGRSSSFAATAAVMGKAGTAEADAGMDAVQRRLMFEDECILVDEQDNVVGHDSKYNCHLMEKINSGHVLHRAFSVFLFNSKYELLLQQRSATKVTFPLVWTNTCCSHPLYRESELIEEKCQGVRNAAQRKLFDELGIQAEELPVDQFIPLGRMLYKAPSDGKWGEHELDYLLFMVRDVRLSPNPEEVADVKYVNRDELKELLKKADAGEGGIKLSPWFRLVVDNFLMGWWDHVEQGTHRCSFFFARFRRLCRWQSRVGGAGEDPRIPQVHAQREAALQWPHEEESDEVSGRSRSRPSHAADGGGAGEDPRIPPVRARRERLRSGGRAERNPMRFRDRSWPPHAAGRGGAGQDPRSPPMRTRRGIR